MSPRRILIVDDSPLIRQVLADMISSEPSLEVVGMAKDGEEAVAKARELAPDLITLDVEMPKLNGIEALQQIMKERPTRVIMVSTTTSSGASSTLEALEAGAIDFVCKPRSGSFMALREVQTELLAKIDTALQATVRPNRSRAITPAAGRPPGDRILLVATSTGGPRALTTLFETLPQEWRLPILVVQHMPAGFTASLAQRLDRIGRIPVREALHGDRVEPGLALVAPGGFHMRIAPDRRIEVYDAPPLHGVRPAADYLFRSAAEVYGNRCIATVLTGMGKDGTAGALEIRDKGGIVLGESESTCTVYGMPRAAKEAGAVNAEYSIEEMGHALVAVSTGRLAHAA